MDRVGPGLLRDLDQLVLHQVAVGRGGATEGVGLVGDLDVQRVAVGLGVDGDRPDPWSLQARAMRTAISPRLAIRTLLMGPWVGA